MKKLILFVFIFLVSSYSYVFAASDYVLPYPSSMPGGLLYKLHLVLEHLDKFWYFGDFGQYTYNLKQSDKYLVEAKTLFEYKQYLLGYNALQKSNKYFQNVSVHLRNAKIHGKDISEKEIELKQAALKHKEVLEKMVHESPGTFIWAAEKENPVVLDIKKLLEENILMRSRSL